MSSKMTLASRTALGLVLAVPSLKPVKAAGPATQNSSETINADTVLLQISQKICTANRSSFKGRREIESGLAGGDGLHANSKIEVTVTATYKTSNSGLNYMSFAQVDCPALNMSIQLQNFDYENQNF